MFKASNHHGKAHLDLTWGLWAVGMNFMKYKCYSHCLQSVVHWEVLLITEIIPEFTHFGCNTPKCCTAAILGFHGCETLEWFSWIIINKFRKWRLVSLKLQWQSDTAVQQNPTYMSVISQLPEYAQCTANVSHFSLLILRHSYQNISTGPRISARTFCNRLRFLRWGVVSTSPKPLDGGPPLSALRDYLFSVFTTTHHIGSLSSFHNLRMQHAILIVKVGRHLWMW